MTEGYNTGITTSSQLHIYFIIELQSLHYNIQHLSRQRFAMRAAFPHKIQKKIYKNVKKLIELPAELNAAEQPKW